MRHLSFVLTLAAIATLAVALWFATRPPPLTVQGEVSADRVDISARVAGRVAELGADVGDRVEKDAVIATLESPELSAGLDKARAALAVAEAQLVQISTPRAETVRVREADLAAAQADVTLYKAIYDRQAELVSHGNAPRQALDEATRNLDASQRKVAAAEAALSLSQAAGSQEERDVAAAQIAQAKAVIGGIEVDLNELTIRAPIDAEVTARIAEPGENFGAGSPLFSLVDVGDPWLTFNLREDLLAGLKTGDEFRVAIPALGLRDAAVRVTVINVQGQFATWRATRATGDFDLRSFEVRAEPVQPIDGLRPGMSVIVDWSQRAARR